MSDIPPVRDFTRIPGDATCMEASPMSGMRYIPCGTRAVAIVASDYRAYYMCKACTMHNLRNRGAALIYATDQELKKMMKEGSVKVVDRPDPRNAPL